MDFDADIICLQEVRALPDQFEIELDGYECFWNPAEKKGYSGTAIISKTAPISVQMGLGIEQTSKVMKFPPIDHDSPIS